MSKESLCIVPNLDGINIQLQIGNETQVQFSTPIGDLVETLKIDQKGHLLPGKKIKSDIYLARLDELCARHGSAINVRFYGFYSEVFDARILERLPNIRSLTINCLHDACHLEAIGTLAHLEDLSLGVFELQQKDILSHIAVENLRSLTLEETNTKALDLAPLANARTLQQLRIFGHKKNIDELNVLNQLNEFVFNPAKGKALDFLNGMTQLRALKLVLGGCENFNDVSLPHLRDLAVTQVRGLNTLGDLSRFPKLERVLVEDQIRLESVDISAKMPKLLHISFSNCKILNALPSLEIAPNLKSITAFHTALSFDDLKLPGSLTHACVHSGSRKLEAAETAAIKSKSLKDAVHPNASFFYK